MVARDGIGFYGKCGLITNHTGVLRDLTSTVDLLKRTCNLTALFAPEHGVRGDRQAGEDILSYTDKQTSLPVYSLYGSSSAENEKILTSLDTVIFDIQDGVFLRECSFIPSFSDYQNTLCRGIQLYITDRDAYSPFATGIRLFHAIKETHAEFKTEPAIVNLLGSDEIFKEGFDAEAFIAEENAKTKKWQDFSRMWQLY